MEDFINFEINIKEYFDPEVEIALIAAGFDKKFIYMTWILNNRIIFQYDKILGYIDNGEVKKIINLHNKFIIHLVIVSDKIYITKNDIVHGNKLYVEVYNFDLELILTCDLKNINPIFIHNISAILPNMILILNTERSFIKLLKYSYDDEKQNIIIDEFNVSYIEENLNKFIYNGNIKFNTKSHPLDIKDRLTPIEVLDGVNILLNYPNHNMIVDVSKHKILGECYPEIKVINELSRLKFCD